MSGQLNLITGGSGFIGTNIAQQLLKKGQSVRILDIVPPDYEFLNGEVDYVEADIQDKAKVEAACNGIDKVYHIVSLVPISKAGKKFWNVNVEGTRNILKACLTNDINNVLHMSSSAIFDIDQPHPLDESSPIKPLGIYAQSKLDGENVAKEFRDKGLNINIVRPRTVVGHGRLGLFDILFDWVRRGKPIITIGDGSNKIQFVHVTDLARACILMTEKVVNQDFNIGTDRYDTLRNDLGALAIHAGTNSKIRGLNPFITINSLKILDKLNLSPLADWHYLSYHRDFYFDVSKAKKMLDWSSNYSNKEMFIEAYDWYIQNYKSFEHDMGTTHKKRLRQGLLKVLRWVT